MLEIYDVSVSEQLVLFIYGCICGCYLSDCVNIIGYHIYESLSSPSACGVYWSVLEYTDIVFFSGSLFEYQYATKKDSQGLDIWNGVKFEVTMYMFVLLYTGKV